MRRGIKLQKRSPTKGKKTKTNPNWQFLPTSPTLSDVDLVLDVE